MQLSEIALSLEYEIENEKVQKIITELNCPREEATVKLYQREWKEKILQFDHQTRCICAMYTRLLPKVQTDGVKKILLRCFQNKITFKPGIGFGVFIIPVLFDYDLFCRGDDYEKKKITLDTIFIALSNNYGIMKVDRDTVLEPYNKIIDQKYNNVWVWNTKRCPDRKHIAELVLHHEVDYIDFYLIIKDNKGFEIKNERIITEVPDEWNYNKHLGELKWNSDKEIALVNLKKDKKWIISID